MLMSLLRSMKCRQVGSVIMSVSISGTAATPAASGTDAMFIDSVVDNGVGDYTISVKEAAKQNLEPVGIVSLTPGAILSVSAVTSDSITIASEDAAAAALDADFIILFRFADQLSYNF